MSRDNPRAGANDRPLSRRMFLQAAFASGVGIALERQASASAEDRNVLLKQCVEALLSRRLADGAIVMGAKAGDERHVIPYFGHLGALGLMASYSLLPSERTLEAVSRWLDWYDAHRNPDGTVYDHVGQSGNWKPTRDYDSTDSYAALYLEILEKLAGVDRKPETLKKRAAGIDGSVRALELTLRPNGLTLAKPTYPVFYTMDNVEGYLGWRSAVGIAKALGQKTETVRFRMQAEKTRQAIETLLWDESAGRYLVALQPDGGRIAGKGEWYPGQMACLMAISWLPASERHRKLFRILWQAKEKLPEAAGSEGDLDTLVWWTMAAQAVRAEDALRTIMPRLLTFDPEKTSLYNTASYGQLLRVLVRSVRT